MDLALEIGVAPDGLKETVARHNLQAEAGTDADSHKGQYVFGRAADDPEQAPNPIMGPLP